MLQLILGFLSGPLTKISHDLKEAYSDKLKAETDKEKLAADERINTLEARKSSILVAQSDPMERWIRILFALPFVSYIWKLVVYDKILGWGVTDGLSPELTQLFWIIIGGYFVDGFIRTAKRKL